MHHSTIASGGYFTLFVDNQGYVWGAGENSMGELGLDNEMEKAASVPFFMRFIYTPKPTFPLYTRRTLPQLNPMLIDIVSVSCGFDFSICVDAHGGAWAFGRPLGFYPFGENVSARDTKPIKLEIDSHIVSSACTYQSTVLLDKKGSVWHLSHIRSPNCLKLDGIPPMIEISCGASHCLMLTEDEQVFAFGENDGEQFGLPCTVHPKPLEIIPISGITDAVMIAASNNHSLVLQRSGAVFVFGSNEYGCLGEFEDLILPVKQLSDFPEIKYIATTSNRSYLVDTFNVLIVLGDTPLPDNIQFNNVASIHTGSCSDSTFLKTNDGQIWAWGSNMEGQLGISSISLSTPPTRLSSYYEDKFSVINSKVKSARKVVS